MPFLQRDDFSFETLNYTKYNNFSTLITIAVSEIEKLAKNAYRSVIFV